MLLFLASVSLKPFGIATHYREPSPTRGECQSSKQRAQLKENIGDWPLHPPFFLLKVKREIVFFFLKKKIIIFDVFILIICCVFSLFFTFLLDAVKD
jgi:hypothetical protein